MGELPSVDTNQDASSYFLSEQQETRPSWIDKLRPVFSAIRYYAIQVWPYVTKVLNTAIYAFISLIKATVKMAIDQVKNFKGE